MTYGCVIKRYLSSAGNWESLDETVPAVLNHTVDAGVNLPCCRAGDLNVDLGQTIWGKDSIELFMLKVLAVW